MPRIVRHQLRAKRVQFLSEPGVYQDGHGLHLRIRESGARHWLVRITVRGKRRDIGLGNYPAVSLEQARFKAEEVRRAAKLGVPLLGRYRRNPNFQGSLRDLSRCQRAAIHVGAGEKTTGGAHPWRLYAFSAIGDRPVAEIGAYQIVDLLKPIWFTRPETSKRVLQRISATFESAILRGQRERANPCTGIARGIGYRT